MTLHPPMRQWRGLESLPIEARNQPLPLPRREGQVVVSELGQMK
jgi:hypothetical protein